MSKRQFNKHLRAILTKKERKEPKWEELELEGGEVTVLWDGLICTKLVANPSAQDGGFCGEQSEALVLVDGGIKSENRMGRGRHRDYISNAKSHGRLTKLSCSALELKAKGKTRTGLESR